MMKGEKMKKKIAVVLVMSLMTTADAEFIPGVA